MGARGRYVPMSAGNRSPRVTVRPVVRGVGHPIVRRPVRARSVAGMRPARGRYAPGWSSARGNPGRALQDRTCHSNGVINTLWTTLVDNPCGT